ncbi:TPA: hypothetical protein CPT81_02990 [Candidatus Gastranaerophilales bacterium HUM_20]|jgi:lipoprotein|nr:MAG: hypothetical protein BHW55_01875 [Candidatus Melainabacteria bacterium 35_41]CDE88863.1 unknown [Clostridium sp. CAG:729]DAB23077.1 MAG TPA: hypothetical protein CPT81_02990 [Candidatus Gastranaerophilales bacterium HUM_20]
MKKLILFCLLLLTLTTACTRDKAAILFNKNPITKDNVYDHSKVFPLNSRIYYLILIPKKVESRYLFIQVIKKDNDYGRLGYNLVWSRDVRLKDEEERFYYDYLVLNEKGFYIMKVYSKDNPQKVLTTAEFYVSR